MQQARQEKDHCEIFDGDWMKFFSIPLEPCCFAGITSNKTGLGEIHTGNSCYSSQANLCVYYSTCNYETGEEWADYYAVDLSYPMRYLRNCGYVEYHREEIMSVDAGDKDLLPKLCLTTVKVKATGEEYQIIEPVLGSKLPISCCR